MEYYYYKQNGRWEMGLMSGNISLTSVVTLPWTWIEKWKYFWEKAEKEMLYLQEKQGPMR